MRSGPVAATDSIPRRLQLSAQRSLGTQHRNAERREHAPVLFANEHLLGQARIHLNVTALVLPAAGAVHVDKTHRDRADTARKTPEPGLHPTLDVVLQFPRHFHPVSCQLELDRVRYYRFVRWFVLVHDLTIRLNLSIDK